MKLIDRNPKLATGAAMAILFLLPGIQAQQQDTRRVEITAKRFQFLPDRVTLKKGIPVLFVLHSEDVGHSIVSKELNLNADIRKGRTSEVRVTPQTVGTFIAKCGHFCGSGHGRMQMTIEVTE